MRLLVWITAGTLMILATSASAQDTLTSGLEADPVFPSHGFLVSGYGSAGYSARFLEDAKPNTFSASLSPVFLFQIRDRFLFESELEFEFEEGLTETSLEYAEILYALGNNFTVGVGKFLLPFNVFSERMHPTWINKLTAAPPTYGGHHAAGGPADPMLPVLADFGVQLRASFDLGGWWYGTAVAYVTQGPQLEVEEHEEEPEPGDEHVELPTLLFGSSVEDNNEQKMVGARIGLGFAPYLEINVSGMTGAYDETGSLDLSAIGTHLELRYSGMELHGEYTRTLLDIAPHEAGEEIETLARDAYFLQVARRFGDVEPVVRCPTS